MEQSPLHDESSERAVLGAVLLAPSGLEEALSAGLAPTHFYEPRHRLIYRAMVSLHQEEQALDLVTLTAALEQQGQLTTCGGYTYLGSLSGRTPSVAHLPSYTAAVLEKSRLREAMATLSMLQEQILSGEDASLVLERAHASFGALSTPRRGGLKPASAIAMDAYEQIRSRRNKGGVTGLPTGFADLDRLLSGFQPSDLIILAARPSMGKTALALNIAAHTALTLKKSTAFFSLEMGELQLLGRLMASLGHIPGDDIRTGNVKDWSALRQTAKKLAGSRLFIDDTASQTVGNIRNKARRVPDLALIVVDYLQLMEGQRGEGTREREIATISRGLKALAKELNVPVLALSQLNRGVEHRTDKRPMISDLRDSGQIEQDADIIIFLYREEVYSPTPGNASRAELLIRKHRNGATGEVRLRWLKDYTRFSNTTPMGPI